MVVCDPHRVDTPIVMANQAFLDLTGYSQAEVIGRNCRFLQGKDTAPEAVDEIRRGLAADEHFVSVELLNYRKDGSAFWNQLHISPVHDEEGETIYYFASQKDVSQRRRAQELEAIERILLMEVDHRAMNALALVESVLSLTRPDDAKRYSDAVRRRIGAIARIHRILAKSSWNGTQLEHLIADETMGDRLRVKGPPAKVAPRLAQPLAIVFHELMTNAEQHGALLNGHGQVSIEWDTPPGRLILKWKEDGAELAEREPEAGLGLSVVRSVVERQLGGTATLSWRPRGLEAKLVVPVGAEDLGS
jgi:PAS domain S-box-containing protein